MRFRTVNHLIRVGAHALTYPRYSTTVIVAGSPYYYYGGTYYLASGSSYVVVRPPYGAVVYAVPAPTTVVYVQQVPYYYYDGAYYVTTPEPAERPDKSDQEAAAETEPAAGEGEAVADAGDAAGEEADDGLPDMADDPDNNYKVVEPPIGVTVPYLPDEAEEKSIKGKKYYVVGETYYKPFAGDGDTIYMVVESPV